MCSPMSFIYDIGLYYLHLHNYNNYDVVCIHVYNNTCINMYKYISIHNNKNFNIYYSYILF